jgi:hypothetical protein
MVDIGLHQRHIPSRTYRRRDEDEDFLDIMVPPHRPRAYSGAVRLGSIIRVIDEERALRSPEADYAYPQWLIIVFAAGIIISALGLLFLAIVPFAKIDGLKLDSASCLVVGTVSIALSLLRGQDLEERLPS